MNIPRRRNPNARWRWQYQIPSDEWIGDLATAEHMWNLASQATEVDE